MLKLTLFTHGYSGSTQCVPCGQSDEVRVSQEPRGGGKASGCTQQMVGCRPDRREREGICTGRRKRGKTSLGKAQDLGREELSQDLGVGASDGWGPGQQTRFENT